MKVTLQNYKRLPGTEGFAATVSISGTPAFLVRNNGAGEPHAFSPLPKQPRAHFRASLKRVKDYAQSLPSVEAEDGSSSEMDDQLLISALVEREICARDLRRKLKTSILFTASDSDDLFAVKAPCTEEVFAKLRDDQKAVKILNTLPFEAALELYLKHG